MSMLHFRPMLAIMLVLVLPGLSLAQVASCGNNTSLPSEPNWSTVLDSNSPGTRGTYIDNNMSPESSGATLPATLTTPGYDGVSGYTSGIGSLYGPDTYAGGPFWAVNQSSLATPSTNCTPNGGTDTGDCNICPSDSTVVDCSGYTIPRTPTDFIRTQHFTTSQGFFFRGSFNGSATIPQGTFLVPAVYFHESALYYGYSEYGFFKNADNSAMYFYWDDNSNCSGLCSDTQGDNSAAHAIYTQQGACQLPAFDPTDDLNIKVWIFQDSGTGTWQFAVWIHDNTLGADQATLVINPNSSTFWSFPSGFPIDWLVDGGPHPNNQGAGFVTMGVARTDPNHAQTSTNNPTMTATSLAIAY